MSDRLQQGSLILTFYRGGWCPYCNLELRAYQKILSQIQTAGASLIAISSQTPDASLSTAEKNQLGFDVLSDRGSKVAQAYNIAFKLPDELKTLYPQFSHALPDVNGTSDWQLPIPATFVIAPNRQIVLAYMDVDYRNRLEPQTYFRSHLMIELYAWATPNSIKVPILLEELELDYTVKPVDIRQGEQKTPEFLQLNPNGKVPVIVDSNGPDHQPIVIVESAAILIYLAEKHGRFIPKDGIGRIRCFEWLFFHASSLGPSFGQSGYFQKLAPEKIPAAIERFHNEAIRTMKILDQRLAEAEYLAGDYSIADIANFGWIWRREFAGIDFTNTPHVARWYAAIEQRSAIQKAIAALA